MRATRLLGALIVLACAGATPVRAVVTGSIFGPGSQTLAIAVVPLESKGERRPAALGGDFARVLSRDLELSGYFRLIDPKTFVEGAGVAPEAIDYVGWSAIGAQELVKGTIETTGDTVTVEVRLFDVAERRDVAEAGRRFQASRSELPRLAHRYADQLLEVLTGERGPFESKIALISTRERPAEGRLRLHLRHDGAGQADQRAVHHAVAELAAGSPRRALHLLPRPSAAPVRDRPRPPRRRRSSRAATASISGAPGRPTGRRCWPRREDDGNSDIELLDRYGRGGAAAHRSLGHRRLAVVVAGRSSLRVLLEPLRLAADLHHGRRRVRAAPGLAHRQLQHVARRGRRRAIASRGRRGAGTPSRSWSRTSTARARARSPARAATRIRRGRRTAATSCSRRRAADGARCGSPIATGVRRNN